MRSQANVQPGGDVATNGASRIANYLMTAAQFQAATGQAAAHGRDDGDRQPAAARADLRRARQQPRHAVREDRAREGHEGEHRPRPLQPHQREHADDVRGDLRPGVRRASGGCGRPRCCSRGSCASTCSSISESRTQSGQGGGHRDFQHRDHREHREEQTTPSLCSRRGSHSLGQGPNSTNITTTGIIDGLALIPTTTKGTNTAIAVQIGSVMIARLSSCPRQYGALARPS